MIFKGSLPDFYDETMLPALKAMAKQEYEDLPLLFPELFNVMGSTQGVEQFAGVTGFGPAREIGQGEDVQYDKVEPTFPKTFKAKKYGLGFKTDRTLIDDDKWGLIAHLASELGRTCRITQEVQAASVINNAFLGGADAGPDGQPLCSASHKIPKTGGLQSNLGTPAQLGVISLQLGLTAFRYQRDVTGNFVNNQVAWLLHAPQNEFIAHELLDGSNMAYTANNTVNSFKTAAVGMPKPLSWMYLTNPLPWFLVSKPKRTGLVWINRLKVYTTGSVDHDSEAAKTAMRYRVAYGHRKPDGIWGNAGQ
jgi:hypothetical protein